MPDNLYFRFSGRYPGYKNSRTRTKGVMRDRRLTKRQEAEARNAKTPIENTARFRRQPPDVQELWLEEAAKKLS